MVTSTLHVINNLSWRVWMVSSQYSDFRTNSESTLPKDFQCLLGGKAHIIMTSGRSLKSAVLAATICKGDRRWHTLVTY